MSRAVLTQAEQESHEQLLACEFKIDSAQKDAWDALRQIHDHKLYKADGYKDFKSYCEQRWGYSKSRAHQLIDHSRIVGYLKEQGAEVLPSGEGQTRAISKLRRTAKSDEDFLQKAANVWEMSVDLAPKQFDNAKITGDHVESVMAQMGVSGRKSAPKSDPAADELKSLFRRFRQTKLYEIGDAEAFIKKHGMDGFPDDFTDMVDLLNDCAALLVR